MIYKTIYLNTSTGELGKVPDLGITNIGGTVGPTFYVGGKPLLFADGTPTDGSGAALFGVSLQGAYSNSNPATIALTSGKPFTLQALNSKFFQIDPDTGKVTITGDLEVMGSSSVIEGVITNVDQVSINPPNGTTSALLIEPMSGVTMTTDLVRIRSSNSGIPDFVITSGGVVSMNTAQVTTINGVNFTAFYSSFVDHISLLNASIKHTAEQISVNETNLTNIAGENVQEVIESIDAALSGVKTHEHIESTAQLVWTIAHNKNSTRPTVTIYDADDDQVWPDNVHVVDANTIEVSFNTAMPGRAIILLF